MRGVEMSDPVVVALIGGRGMLARAVLAAAPSWCRIVPLSRPEIDIVDTDSVSRALGRLRPRVIVNCAACTNVDGCETDIEAAFSVNERGPENLARAACELGATLIHISTDYVYPGDAGEPYKETDATGPGCVYGRSKLAGEQAIAASGLSRYFIIRTSWLYGPGGKNFVETMVRLGREREELGVVADQIGCPTLTADLAQAVFNLVELEINGACPPYGVYNFSNEGFCSWHAFAEAILAEARAAGEPIIAKMVKPIGTADYPLPAKRPAYSVLSKDKYRRVAGVAVPHWRDSLARYFKKERA